MAGSYSAETLAAIFKKPKPYKMRISQKRIRLPENYLTGIANNENFYVGLSGIQDFSDKLIRIGFSTDISVGEQVLPTIIRSVTRFNANGGNKIRRDLPKETVYREAEIKDWHGNYHTVDIPYQRYPREPIAAPNIELLIRYGADNTPILISPILTNNKRSLSLIKHVINLFLEIFGECEILKSDLLPAFNVHVTRLNWDILPPGNYPWEILAPRIAEVVESVTKRKQNLIQNRIKKISDNNINFVAVGKAGFRGYIIFGFENKNFFVLESVYTGNATYVLGQNWKEISQLTKEQILKNNLHEQRIVHSKSWEIEIKKLLN